VSQDNLWRTQTLKSRCFHVFRIICPLFPSLPPHLKIYSPFLYPPSPCLTPNILPSSDTLNDTVQAVLFNAILQFVNVLIKPYKIPLKLAAEAFNALAAGGRRINRGGGEFPGL